MYIRKATRFFVVILFVIYIFIHNFCVQNLPYVGMPTENAYFFEHLFSSHLGLACALLVEINICSKFVVIFTDFKCEKIYVNKFKVHLVLSNFSQCHVLFVETSEKINR